MSVNETIAMRLRRTYMSMHRHAQQHFAPFGVTADQYVVLSILAEHEGLRQQELAERANSDANTIAAMLALLEKKRLVRRRSDKNDGRVKRVSLTAAGGRLQEKLSQSVEPLHEAMEQAVGEHREELFVALQQLEAVFSKSQTLSQVG